MSAQFDVLGIGNAIMDVIAPISEADLKNLDIAKGGMTLIDQKRALDLTKEFTSRSGDLREIAGGSAANTLVGIANLGVRAAYIGKVANDKLGQRMAKGFREAGVHYATPPLKGGDATARCLVAVTPDGERSMSTFLGASVMFNKKDLVADLIKNSNVTYLEGYLFDKDEAKAAFVKASEIAKGAGRDVALTLSDSFCVDRHRDSFKDLIKNHVDIVFANEAELLSLYETDDFKKAASHIKSHAQTACVTRSEKGSVIFSGGQTYEIPVCPVNKLVDTTGAGDQYAAGVLAGYAQGLSWEDAGYLGSQCAAEVISHYGARPELRII